MWKIINMQQLQESEIIERSKSLKAISPVIMELIQKLSEPFARREEIEKLVKLDEVLLLNVFKVARSAAFGAHRDLKTVSEALDLLGQYGLRDLVFSIIAKSIFVSKEIWYKSIFIGTASKKIAEKLGYEAPRLSDIYIASLMLCSGDLVFKLFYKEQYQAAEKEMLYENILKKEQEVFGINSVGLANHIVLNYGMPDKVIDLLSRQSKEWQDPSFIQENAIIYLAKVLLESECEDYQDIEDSVNSRMLSLHKLDQLDISPELVAELHKLTEELIDIN